MANVRLTGGERRVQNVSLQIITSGREVIPKKQQIQLGIACCYEILNSCFI